MNEDLDFSRFLTVGIVLLLMAFGGWGAFAYSVGAAQLRDRALQRELSQAATERQTLAGELDRLRVISDRDRQALDRANRSLADTQQHAASLSEQLRGREAGAASPFGGALRPGPAAPTRQASGVAARQ